MFKSSLMAAAVATVAMAAPAFSQDVIVDSVTRGTMGLLPMHVGGRVHQERVGYSYQWPGVYFEGRFSSPFVNLMFDDSANNFNVLLDGKLLMVVRKPGRTTLMIQTETPGLHTVRVEKRSETQYATGHFIGMMGVAADPPPDSARRIEFIGDSFVVGYGNTSAYTQCTSDEVFETTNAQEGFGPIVAKHFDADYRINAFSGLGMVRNYGGYEHPKYHMPMLYPRTIYDAPTPAKDDWQPQVIFINIGGNDFSTPLAVGEPWKTAEDLRQDYMRTYVTFVQGLRKRYPQAYFLLTSSPNGSTEYANSVTAVVDTLKSKGETRIERLIMPPLQFTGCNSHPDVRSDHKVADLLIDYLSARPDLWPQAANEDKKAGN